MHLQFTFLSTSSYPLMSDSPAYSTQPSYSTQYYNDRQALSDSGHHLHPLLLRPSLFPLPALLAPQLPSR